MNNRDQEILARFINDVTQQTILNNALFGAIFEILGLSEEDVQALFKVGREGASKEFESMESEIVKNYKSFK